MDPAAFQAAVKNLDAKTCDRCARDLFHRFGATAIQPSNGGEYWQVYIDDEHSRIYIHTGAHT